MGPAQAVGLTDHPGPVDELIAFPAPGLGIEKRGALPGWFRHAARVA